MPHLRLQVLKRHLPTPLQGAFVVAASAGSGLLVYAARPGADAGRAWAFVSLVGVLIVVLVRRDVITRRKTEVLLADRESLIKSIGVVTDPKLSQLPLYQLLDELLARARTVMAADTAAVLLHDRSKRRLVPAAVSGAFDGTDVTSTDIGVGVIGQVALGHQAQAFVEAPVEPGIVPGTVSLVAVALVAEGQLVGVLQVGTRQRRVFGSDDLRLLQLVADRVAAAVDASRLDSEAQRARLAVEGARQRLALLADAGDVLARSFDSADRMMWELAATIAPRYADWFGYHQVSGQTSSLVAWHAAGEVPIAHDGPGDWRPIVDPVVRLGAAACAWGDRLEEDEYQVAAKLGLTSVAVIPVLLLGEVVGAMSFGTAGRRRGLRASDIATGQDLAARFAVALERVQLGAETHRSAVRAANQAAQLQRLTQGAFAINASVTAEELAWVVAEQAALILDADVASVELQLSHGVQRVRAGADKDPPGGHRLIAAIFHGPSAPTTGSLTVIRKSPPFAREDEAILSSLAQIASVAVTNARLYGDVQESRTRLRALYDALPVAIVELDAQARGMRWNREAEWMFAWPVFREPLQEPVELPEAAREVVYRVLAGEAAHGVDVVLSGNGSSIAVELVIVPLSEQDEVVGAVLVAVDITERKHVAEQLQQAQRMEAMARMAGGIAHDFNNVLMVITGYADLLLRRPLGSDVRKDVEAMRAAAVRAAEFTRKLLTISRRQVVQPELVDVGDAVRSLEDVLRVMVGPGVVLVVEVEDPPPVLIDQAQLEQVVLNLAINARDAMDGSGEIQVRTWRGDDGWAELTVSDGGKGMEPEALEHCFEPFFTTKERSKGTGLGLSTVYGVVSQANGTISVTSELGVGTTFHVRLPPGSHAHAAMVKVSSAAATARLRVLVVDDEPEVRAVVADLLELEGHEVVVATGGAEALEVAADWVPDVVLTDVVMPGLRGPDLASAITDAHPGVRVVLMSSHVDDELALDARLGSLPFLAKPFSGDALLELFSSLSGERSPAG